MSRLSISLFFSEKELEFIAALALGELLMALSAAIYIISIPIARKDGFFISGIHGKIQILFTDVLQFSSGILSKTVQQVFLG